MKKTLIALMALASVALGANGDLTQLYTFESLKGTLLGQGNITVDTTTYDQTVYDCSEAPFYKYDSSTTTSDIGSILTGVTEGTTLTFAAWVNHTSSAQYQYLVSWGEDGKGFKFGINSGKVCLTTKGGHDYHDTGVTVIADEWNLIATTITYVDTDKWTISVRNVTQDTTAYWSNKTFNNPTNDAMIGLLSSSAQSGDEQFKGELASLGVFSSTGTYSDISNASILSAMGPAPIPEPATATLSLLALAGLCARRRRG